MEAIGRVIYGRRKELGLTQEQLAEAVGVSAAAVSKWETGATAPAISLLAPLSRMLRLSLDELLCFEEKLSDEKLETIRKEMEKTAEEKGLEAGIETGMGYLREYPDSEWLKLCVAMLPFQMPQLAADEELLKKAAFGSKKLLEQLRDARESRVRASAETMLAGLYIGEERLNEAEAILKEMPEEGYDARHIFPSLYFQMGEEEKVLQSSQANMLKDVQALLTDIWWQYNVYMKRKDYDSALRCAKDYSALLKRVKPPAMCAGDILTDVYLAMGKEEEAVKCYCDYLDEIMSVSGDYRGAFYYSHLAGKVSAAQPGKTAQLRKMLYLLAADERYTPLLQWDQAVKKRRELEKRIERENTSADAGKKSRKNR